MQSYNTQTRVDDVMRALSWDKDHYRDFLATVKDEGKTLMYGRDYWVGRERPEEIRFDKLPREMKDQLVEKVRAELKKKNKNMHWDEQIDLEIIRWKLNPWLRDEQKKIARERAKLSQPSRSRTSGYYDPVADAAGRM